MACGLFFDGTVVLAALPKRMSGQAAALSMVAVGEDALAASRAVMDFAQIYEAYFRFVWRNVRRLGIESSAVDDVVQDVFITINRRLATYVECGMLRSWIYGIVRRVVAARRRTRQSAEQLLEFSLQDLAEPSDKEGSPYAHAERAEQTRMLFELLSTLKESQREVLMLTEFDELTAPEIAAALEIPLNTVYSRLRLAREALVEASQRYQARESAGRNG